jgi:hypothetical protein
LIKFFLAFLQHMKTFTWIAFNIIMSAVILPIKSSIQIYSILLFGLPLAVSYFWHCRYIKVAENKTSTSIFQFSYVLDFLLGRE